MNKETIEAVLGDSGPLSIPISKGDLDLSPELTARLRDWHLHMVCLLNEKQLIENARRGPGHSSREEQHFSDLMAHTITTHSQRAAALHELIALKKGEQ